MKSFRLAADGGDTGDGLLESGAEDTRDGPMGEDTGFVLFVDANGVYAVFFYVEAIVMEFVFDPEEDESGAGDADGEAKNIETAVGLFFPDVREGSLEIVF